MLLFKPKHHETNLFYSILFATTAYSQETLFRIVELSETITSEDAATINKLIDTKEQPQIVEGWVINFNDFKTTDQIELQFDLPDVRSTLKLKSEHITEIKGTLFGKVNYTLWGGTIYGPRKEGNFFLLKDDDGAIGGFFQFNGQGYDILPVNKEYGVLRKSNFDYFSETSCAAISKSNQEGETNSDFNNFSATGICDSPPSSCSNAWKIINAYPQADIDMILALNNGNTIAAGFFVAIVRATFINTLQNSGIGAPNLTIVDENIGNYTPTSSNISVAADDFNDYAKANLARRGYDKIVLCTYFSFGSANGTVNCTPYNANGGLQPDCNVAVVNLAAIWVPRLVYAHEVGHLFGARHDAAQDPEPICGKGKIFTLGNEDKTVMATFLQGGSNPNANATSSRILRFSEFLAYYNGFHIGGSNVDNKRLVQNFICENYNLLNQEPPVDLRLDLKSDIGRLKLYPNPVDNEINLNLLKHQVQKVELLSGSGYKLAINNLLGNEDKVTIDVSKLTVGIYYLKLTTSNKTETIKFIKI